MNPWAQELSLNRLAGVPLAHRFGVFCFLAGLLPNPLDIRFQKVSGIGAKIETTTVIEGGQNHYAQRLPTRVTYANLVLERGFVVGSALTLDVHRTLSSFSFAPSLVLVVLFNESAIPIAGWGFEQAYPVQWRLADLNGTEDKLLIETLELAYTRMYPLEV